METLKIMNNQGNPSKQDNALHITRADFKFQHRAVVTQGHVDPWSMVKEPESHPDCHIYPVYDCVAQSLH